jgi:RNA 3'-terminal phosphate cyclase (ATP)
MIEIDGSFGEGGGQIVRTAVALAAVTGTALKITKIRQGRPKPGLAAQHSQAILALAKICSARTNGVFPGSNEIFFEPGQIEGGNYRIDIGTAGSITLLLQCLLPAILKADKLTTLTIVGGTDVRWSPTIDYFKFVFLPALEEFGAKIQLECKKRGYYPRGGGLVVLTVVPGNMKAAHFKSQNHGVVHGLSLCSNLPDHVARRQAESAASVLKDSGYQSKLAEEVLEEKSTGSSITLWSGYKGSSALGQRGIRAEDVGKAAAKEIIAELAMPAAVDVHLADQLIPYLAIAGGSYTVREISKHASTNIWTASHFLKTKIEIEEKRIFEIRGNSANSLFKAN